MSYPIRSPITNFSARWDLRSDTTTRPCEGMRRAMAEAEVGDDVFGDDATVQRLEDTVAEMMGKEAALFMASGTQSNLAALLAHCGRGEEVIVGDQYHVFIDEAGGASALGSIPYLTLPVREDGSLEPAAIAGALTEDDPHFTITRLLSLENTVHGRAVKLDVIRDCVTVARENDLATHLDGARFFNACAALGCQPTEMAKLFDTISTCMSKGLGAPIGSVLTGSKDIIHRAHRWRKMLGGGMRQVGVLAAAALYGIEHVRPRLIEDHQRAEEFANFLRGLGAGEVEQATNMVFFTPEETSPEAFARSLQSDGIAICPARRMRYVFHRQIDDEGLAAIQTAFVRALKA